jgi:hypothetical protein
VLLSAGETIELIVVDQGYGYNAITPRLAHFSADIFQKRIRTPLPPSIADPDIKEGLEILDIEGARVSALIHTEHLDDKHLIS